MLPQDILLVGSVVASALHGFVSALGLNTSEPAACGAI